MGFLMPKVSMPALPPAPAPAREVPDYDSAAREEEVRLKRQRVAAARKGRSSTILTSSRGVEDDPSVVAKKTLLGG
tara:strand:+ start:1968 stop:2195 length:228 start_codon:yes stop_codon:yes gene_type:complete